MLEEPQSSKQHAMENEQQSKGLLHGSGTVEGNRTLDEPQCSKSRRARSSMQWRMSSRARGYYMEVAQLRGIGRWMSRSARRAAELEAACNGE